MKKIGLYTLNGYVNYGNRLQNYALMKKLEIFGNVETIWFSNIKSDIKEHIKTLIVFKKKYRRHRKFYNFSKKLNIRHYRNTNINHLYDYFVVGSDQVWNYTFDEFGSDYFLKFSDYNKNISYAASIGTNYIPEEYISQFQKGISNIKYISVREKSAKEMLEKITKQKIELLIDPTLLLTSEEWDYVAKKPKKLKAKKYILTYFLGELSQEKKEAINKVATENECEIINILDPKCNLYDSGPEEFIYLEKHAFLVCTDSFHACVFAFIYNKPFIIFEREEKNMSKMGTRIDNLLTMFELKNRRYKGNITKENLVHDYNKSYLILEEERKKSILFLENALKDSD